MAFPGRIANTHNNRTKSLTFTESLTLWNTKHKEQLKLKILRTAWLEEIQDKERNKNLATKSTNESVFYSALFSNHHINEKKVLGLRKQKQQQCGRTTIPLASKSLQKSSANGWHRVEIWRFPTSTEFLANRHSSRWSFSSRSEPATVEMALIVMLTACWRINRSDFAYETDTANKHSWEQHTTQKYGFVTRLVKGHSIYAKRV